jgi:hypothetical protein
MLKDKPRLSGCTEVVLSLLVSPGPMSQEPGRDLFPKLQPPSTSGMNLYE